MDPGYQWPCNNSLEDGSKCQAPIRVGRKFCKKCGAPAGPPVCPQCSTPLDGPEDVYCGECGIKVRGVFQPCSSRESSVVGSHSVHSGSSAGSAHQNEMGKGDAATVTYDDYVHVKYPYATSEVSMSSSISQKPPNDASSQPVPPLMQQGGYMMPAPGYFPRGPHPQLTPAQMRSYQMAMLRYGPPAMVPVRSPYMFMPHTQPPLPGSMDQQGAQFQHPYPPQGAMRMPHMMPDAMAPGMQPNPPFHIPPTSTEPIHNEPTQGAEENNSEHSFTVVSPMDIDTSSNPPETNQAVQENDQTNQSQEPCQDRNDGKEVCPPLDENHEPDNEPSTDTDRLPTHRTEPALDLTNSITIPVSDTSLSLTQPVQEPSQHVHGPQHTLGDAECRSVAPLPSNAPVTPAETEPSDQPLIYTNKNVFGSTYKESAADSLGSESTETRVFGGVSSTGGGDSKLPDEKIPSAGSPQQNDHEHGDFFKEQERLQKQSRMLLASRKPIRETPNKQTEPDASVPQTSQEDPSEQFDDFQADKDSGRVRTPGELTRGRRSPKREADSEIDELDERFKKLPRSETVPETNCCDKELASGTSLASPRLSPSMLRPREVPACGMTGVSPSMLRPLEAPACGMTGEVQICLSGTSPRKDSIVEQVPKPFVDTRPKDVARQVDETSQATEQTELAVDEVRKSAPEVTQVGGNTEVKAPNELQMIRSGDGEGTQQIEKYPVDTEGAMPGKAGAKYGKPVLEEGQSVSHGVSSTKTDLDDHTKRIADKPYHNENNITDPNKGTTKEIGEHQQTYSQTEGQRPVREEQPMDTGMPPLDVAGAEANPVNDPLVNPSNDDDVILVEDVETVKSGKTRDQAAKPTDSPPAKDLDPNQHPISSEPGLPYRKPDQPDDFTTVSNRKKKRKEKKEQQEGKDYALRSKTDSKVFTIHFYVVVDPGFKCQEKKSVVSIRFAEENLGGWHSFAHKMHPHSTLDDGYQLMTCSVGVPAWIVEHRSVIYKYCVSRDKDEWEYLPKYYSQYTNRQINIDRKDLVPNGSRIQFDGIMMREKTGFVSAVVAKFRKDPKVLEVGLYYMLTTVEALCKNAPESKRVELIHGLYVCLHQWPHVDDISSKNAAFQTAMLEMVTARIQSLGKKLKTKTPDDNVHQLGLAMAMAIFITRYKLQPERHSYQILCDALLVRPDPETQQCHDYDELLNVHFADSNYDRGYLANTIKVLIKNITDQHLDEPKWLNSVPLLHFLTGQCEPFGIPHAAFTRNHENENWWGIVGIKPVVEKFKYNYSSKDKALVKHTLTKISDCYELDPLLPRTVLASMSGRHLESVLTNDAVPIDALLAMIHYHLKLNLIRFDFKECLGTMTKKVLSFEEQCVDESTISESILQIYNSASSVAIDLLRLVSSTSAPYINVKVPAVAKFTIEVIRVRTYISSTYTRLFPNNPDRSPVAQEDLPTNATNILLTWLQRWLPLKMISVTYLGAYRTMSNLEELNVWSSLYNINVLDEKRTQWWHKQLTDLLSVRISQTGSDVLDIYCHHLKYDVHHTVLIDCITEFAFNAGKEFFMCERKADHGRYFSQDMYDRIGPLFSRVFLHNWPKSANGQKSFDQLVMLKHALTMPSFSRFLGLLGEENSQILNDDCQQCLTFAISMIGASLEELGSGRMVIERLNLILEKENRFIENVEVAGHLWTKGIPNTEILKRVLDARRAELNALRSLKKDISELINVCESVEYVDYHVLEERLRIRVDCLNLNEVCDPIIYNVEEKKTNYESPVITFFGLTKEVEDAMAGILHLKDSLVYRNIFTEIAKRYTQVKQQNDMSRPSIQDLATDVWPKSNVRWKTLCKKVKDGSISLRETDRHFQSFYRNSEVLQNELRFMCQGKDCEKHAGRRMEEMDRYLQLAQCEEGARIAMGAKDELGLTGDFSILERILGATKEKSSALSTMTRDVLVASDALKGFTRTRQKCLQIFNRCKPLVDWLREHVPKAQELKALVDLALIAATGKGDYEVTKVSCLHAAVSGFTPLIYDLRPDANFTQFYHLCEAIWTTLETDPELPKKLMDINKDLEWLKGVKDAQGDVEINALKQVAIINNGGIYTVDNKGNKSTVLMKLDDMVHVDVVDEKDVHQRYSLSDLKELQSKLMLVAGKAEKGKEDVDKFVEVFDGVTSLANTFIKICTAGSILFKDWSAKFYCDPHKNVNTMVNFGMSKGKLAGRNENASVIQQITQIRDFMEGCLEEWKAYITEQRRTYPQLNHYTTEQLVILRSELTCLTSGQKCPTEEVFALLHDISPDCNLDTLRAAFRDAIADIKSAEAAKTKEIKRKAERHRGDEMDEDVTEEDEQDPDQERERVIRLLIAQGYRRSLVEYVINHFGMEDVDLLEWKCQDLEEEELPIVDTTAETEVVIEDCNILQSDDTLDHTTKTFLQELSSQKTALSKKLKDLWKMFLDSASLSVADYLSVQHLGLILQKLCKCTPLPRHLPPYLHEGHPNLIVCPQNEVLVHVLSAYMEDEDLPMPRREEVLLCTDTTTLEEVELLIWRSVQDTSGRIFMLVGADQLNYEAAGQVEMAMQRHMQGHSHYRFIVVCAAEKQDKTVLVAALDNYRIHSPVPQSSEQVKHYIHKHLTDDTGANRLDPERCTVRVVRSDRAGAGKSLWVNRRKDQIAQHNRGVKREDLVITLPLHGSTASVLYVLRALLSHVLPPGRKMTRLIHIDIPHEMLDGVDHILFNLVVLGSLVDHVGYIWQRSRLDYYTIEIMPLQKWEIGAGTRGDDHQAVHQVLELLPTVTCRSPQESLEILQQQQQNPNYKPDLFLWSPNDQLMDMEEFCSVPFQRVYQYLQHLGVNANLRDVDPFLTFGTPVECLEVLLRYCGLENPSWSELVHFINFLNLQLETCERSSFCTIAATSDDTLPGFLQFVVRFMIQMSKDFSTRSLVMAEESPGSEIPDNEQEADGDQEITQFKLKRRWETSPHPYIFFNPDGATMTFLGFIVQRPTYDIIDAQTRTVLERKIMNQLLFNGLVLNGANLNEQFNDLSREEKIAKLSMVMGINVPHDPDDKYVLTTDNVKKILAIQMRFRCGIPVVIMGETGCGKTQLIKFMSKLQNPPGMNVKNMILMKVHGGTTEEDIIRKVREAEEMAKLNRMQFPAMYTVLFLDEVNTTEALGLVKEVLCDLTLKGKPLDKGSGLKLIAACNPYRKHSKDVIDMLEKAGLGYHVSADETRDKLGRIPMRRLVYRVQPLPQSMLPLVWDFGQLSTSVEKMYIQKIVQKKMVEEKFGIVVDEVITTITDILVAAQEYMRNQQDECSFVSLRDVERAMDVMEWFYNQENLYECMDRKMMEQMEEEAKQRRNARSQSVDLSDEEASEDEMEDEGSDIYEPPDEICRALILAIGVCYHACLQEKREDFREHISQFFRGENFELDEGAYTILQNISLCQDVILNEVELGPNIARNQALKENVFMMVVCIELRIPLFLVGKPGSSKSLARTIVVDSMQGPQSRSKLFKSFKQVYMVSYQCSPLSTPDGIVSTFQQCAQLQKDKQDLDKFVAVVVLDEVGLAEDSPRMPLKTLHPLLEDGCQEDEESERYKKVGFIGISNWALDPAKMNRGILVQRGPPDETELRETAKDICSSDPIIQNRISKLMTPLARAYLDLYKSAITEIREFFGLRDFYSLVKMVHGFSAKNHNIPTWRQLEHAILRNFGGLDRLGPVKVFGHYLHSLDQQTSFPGDPDNSPSGLLRASLCGDGLNCESRYLLLLTENYAALTILMQNLEDMRDAIIIFGSSFPKDQEYTVVCRNINRIKVCMETGQTVVLLNLENLYESLYDALNQYYTYFGGQRHVDLGLGGHRVKSRVHEKFKLIVVAEKEVVYKKFPIPLINRLEKHFMAMSTMLTEKQKEIVEELEAWTLSFSRPLLMQSKTKPCVGDSFIGYHQDTCASIVLQVCHEIEQNDGDETWKQEVFHRAKVQLLWCATPESVIRIKKTGLLTQEKDITDIYFSQQQHGSLIDFLQAHLADTNVHTDAFIQVTTHSRILSNKSVKEIAHGLNLPNNAVKSHSLQAFNTEQQFSKLFRSYFTTESGSSQVMIIQCDSGDQNAELIACARYIIWDEYKQVEPSKNPTALEIRKHVVLVIQLPRVTGGCFTGFEGGKWQSVHLDDLRMVNYQTPGIDVLKRHTISDLIGSALHAQPAQTPELEPGRVDERMEEEGEEDNDDDDESIMVLSEEHLEEPMVVVNEEPSEEAGAQLDFNQLVHRCIHGAASMVKDQVDTGSSTARITKLFKLFSMGKEKGRNYSDVMKSRIFLLLRDKERTHMNTDMALNWLVNDAASVEVINKAGTFRRAISLCLEMKVTPMLAGLIAYIDTNNNLDIVTSDDVADWKCDMWLNIFRDPAISALSYGDLLSAKRNTELVEMTVRMFGAEGSRMNGSMPFSWLIKQQVDILIDQKKRVSGSEGLADAVGHLLKETTMWPVLEKAFTDAEPETFISCYLDDLVKMVYRPQTKDQEAEYELVKRAIRSTVNRLHNLKLEVADWEDEEAEEEESFMEVELPKLDHENILPVIHIAEAAIHSRLQLFSQVALCCPDIIGEVREFYERKEAHPLITNAEMTLDILTVHLVVNRLQPNPKLLKNKNDNRQWHERIEKLGPLINDVLARSQRIEGSGLGYYGVTCTSGLEDIRLDWNRVTTVKLFADIVCPQGSDQEKNITKNCPLLWKKLENADFKTEVTMKEIEKFLIFVTKMASEQYSGEMRQCNLCGEVLLEMMVMPCKHKVCPDCVKQLQDSRDFSCPECKKTYKEGRKLDKKEGSKDQLKKLQVFKRRCNSFLMEVVSRLCFAGDRPPQAGVVRMLMNYITSRGARPDQRTTRPAVRTKQMNLFNENLDPTPVIRSVLLQLLLRSSVDVVREHLVNYFAHAEQFMTEQDSVELAILYTQCLEDHYHNVISAGDVKAITQKTVRLLQQCREDLNYDQDKVTKLEGIAKLRFCLSVTARLMHARRTVNIDHSTLTDLFLRARTICANNEWLLPGLYLIRLLVRRYGMETLLQVAADPQLSWVLPEYVRPKEDDMRPDFFIVCGGIYHEMRQTLAKTLINCADTQPLTTMLATIGRNDIARSQGLLLALFSEITSTFAYGDASKRPSNEAIGVVRQVIQGSHSVQNKELAEALIGNTLGINCPSLCVAPNNSYQHLIITEIITHFGIAMTTVPKNAMLHPFLELISNPAAMRPMYLPTMPEDVRAEMLEALLAGRRIPGFENENPSLYECPNGHPYIIGNCGRPYFERRCYQCGEMIGGVQHQLRTGRRVDIVQDTTQPGHVLGDAANRRRVPDTDRNLSPASFTLTRLLVHLSLYLGANTNPQAVLNLIHPGIAPNTLSEFLWRHIDCDLEVISKAVGKGKDDSAVLVHLLINELSFRQGNARINGTLDTKKKRGDWEKAFTTAYIAPLLQELDTRLQRANHDISHDKRLGENPLLKMVHESEREGEEAVSLERLEQVPAMWRYRTRVTMEHLTQDLNEKRARQAQTKKHQILDLFLHREPELRIVQLLPRILHLIRKLSHRYHRKIDRAEADTLKIEDFLQGLRPGAQREEFEELFRDFCTAWKAVHTQLSTHVVSDHVLPEEYANLEIGKKTPLSTLLPSLRGRGLCAIALLHYLTTVHNQFMSDYSRLSKTKLGHEVSFLDLTPAHLMTYDLDRDLLPLVLANCTYSLAVGQGTSIEYNFTSLEEQLVERFIRGKSLVAFQLEPVVFLEDLTNATLFTNLEKKIPQVALTPAIKAQIRADIRYIMEVTDCLSNLDITIGFLVSVGGDPSTRLQTFMHDTLRMDEAILTPKARQHCKLQHTRSLWLLLSHEREKMAARYKQEAFTSVDASRYKEPLSEEQKQGLETVLKHMNVDVFLSALYECIVMQLTVRRNPNDEDYVDNINQKLNEALYGYIENQELPEVPALTGGNFPDITVQQCVETWKATFAFSVNQDQRR